MPFKRKKKTLRYKVHGRVLFHNLQQNDKFTACMNSCVNSKPTIPNENKKEWKQTFS